MFPNTPGFGPPQPSAPLQDKELVADRLLCTEVTSPSMFTCRPIPGWLRDGVAMKSGKKKQSGVLLPVFLKGS